MAPPKLSFVPSVWLFVKSVLIRLRLAPASLAIAPPRALPIVSPAA